MNKSNLFAFKNALIKTSFLVFCIASLNFEPALAAANIEKMDRIVAVADQNAITEQELQDHVKGVLMQLEKQGTPAPAKEVLEKQVLERLISDSLQLQFANQTGIKVDNAQLDKTIERIAEQNKLSLSAFKASIEAQGTPYQKFREDIRTEVVLARLREREVDSKINVSEAEVDSLLATQAATGGNQDAYDLSLITIRIPENSAPDTIQKLKTKAEDAIKKLQSGMSFAQVSASYSDAPNALQGGNIGWKSTAEIPALFSDALKEMQPKQLSPILRSPNGFHIIKINDKRNGETKMVIQQSHVRHILIKINEIQSEDDSKRKLDIIKERINYGTPFTEMARQYSEDGSASNGGDLGWVNPGDTVPQFENAMNTLKINEVSAPVHSPFGWHLIQVLERRSQDVSKEATRLKARQELRTKKSDEAYQDWLRELRDRAYVELRLEDKD